MNDEIFKNIENIALKEAINYDKNFDLDKFKKNFTEANVVNYNFENNNFISDKIKFNNIPNYTQREEFTISHINKLKISNFNLTIGYEDEYKNDWGIFTYSKNKFRKNILIPDLYALNSYDGKLKQKDLIPKNLKIDKIIFAGTDTGNWFDLKLNQRLDVCSAFANHSFINAKITNLVQLPRDKILSVYPNLNDFLCSPISINEQLKYKFILSIDGNSTAWDRVPWIMNSNSMLFKYESDNVNWYYGLMKDKEHYINCNKYNMENKFMYYLNNPKEYDFIVSNANEFVKKYLTYDSHMLYLKLLIEKCKEKNQ